MDVKEDVNGNIRVCARVMKDVLKEEIGNSSLIIKDQMKMQIANWNYKMSDSLVEQADEMIQLTNSDETNTHEIVNKNV